MTLEKVFADINKGVLAPCYLLYGEEEYLINETLQKILDLIMPQADRDFGLFFLEDENADIDNINNLILTPSLLGGRKVFVVKNTTIFHSRDNLAKLISKIRDNLDENPAKAAKSFLTFLNIAGFTVDDLQDSGWQKITNEEWSKIVKGDTGEDREKWLPRILEIYSSSGLTGASGAAQTDRLEEILKAGLPSGNCLIFTAETVDKRKKIYKIIADTGVAYEFVKVEKEGARREILQKEAQKLLTSQGKKMSSPAWIALGRKTGFDLRRSMSELEKLISFVGEHGTIEEKDVEEAVGRTKEDNIFVLTNALVEKNQLAALDALKNLLDQGTHHLIILSMIVREIRLMLQARILMDSGKLPKFNQKMDFNLFQKVIYPTFGKLNASAGKCKWLIFSEKPYPVYLTLRKCLNFNSSRLVGLLDELLEIDIAFKSTQIDPQVLLEIFLIKACAKDF
jgi:DNA polymerase-3 subunit delta